MNKIILSTLAFLLCFVSFSQNRSNLICRVGFTYEISNSPNWGNGKPIITGIYPYSQAEQSGLQINDIIERINGIPVSEITPEQLPLSLNPAGKDEVTLTVSNLSQTSKQIVIKKECKQEKALTEDVLASTFFLLSPETCFERTFRCPFKTTSTLEAIDFSEFRSFNFSGIDESASVLELFINECIVNELEKKGLFEDTQNPDFAIQTYYFFDQNPDFRGSNIIEVQREPIYRFDPVKSRMEAFPFLHPRTAESESPYLLQLGFRFVDMKINPGRILWECEANERLEDAYSLENYALTHIPLMCMQYPYVKYAERPLFKVKQAIYNYTGIHYDIDQLNRIIDTDPSSPARDAGIRRGDRILSINGASLDLSAEQASNAYKEFITETMDLRDPSTRFTDIAGFRYCMSWKSDSYTKVADAIRQSENELPFSYLYFYAPYVNRSGNNTCLFEIERGNNKLEMNIRPLLRTEQTVVIY